MFYSTTLPGGIIGGDYPLNDKNMPEASAFGGMT